VEVSPRIVLLIALGGAAGAVCRFLVGAAARQAMSGVPLPIGTLAVNLLGCLLIGILFGGTPPWLGRPEVRAALGVGFLGAFTTFSTFALDLTDDRPWRWTTAYLLLSNAGGVALVLLGLWVGRAMIGRG
jgi:CrcB protein